MYSQKDRNILHTTKRRKAIWIGHILHRNCLLKQVMEGNLEGAGRRGRRQNPQIDDLKQKKRY